MFCCAFLSSSMTETFSRKTSCVSMSFCSISVILEFCDRMYSAWFSILVLRSLTTDASPAALPCTALAAWRAIANSSWSVACCWMLLSLSASRSATLATASLSADPPSRAAAGLLASSSLEALSSAWRLLNFASVSSFLVLMPSLNRINFSRNASWLRCRSSSSSFRLRRSCACLSASACSSSTLALSLSFSLSSAAFTTGVAGGKPPLRVPL
mmetsp:Transcript_47379/g.118532  ORF Transcript_47379/g.118532 Transcript_47379/m.118532 type:complete len:213 (-) Transcript_47379:594-1232(-)